MTAVEIARARLAQVTAKRAAPKKRVTRTRPRHGDSGTQLALEGAAESVLARSMTTTADALPDDVGALRALILAERAEREALAQRNAQLAERVAIIEGVNAKLEHIVAELKRAQFGRRSERITDDQLALALDELETAAAKANAEAEKADPERKAAAARKRRASRDEKLDHLPHEEVVIEPESKVCPCCGGALHVIGEDMSKRLDKVPATLRVIVTRRPRYACRTCERTGSDEVAGIIQAPAPARLIEGGLPTERLVADVVVSKYAEHLPLYRQSQILARHGVTIERSTLAQWVGAAAAELQPLHDRLLSLLKVSPKLFCDETRCPVLDPGRGKTKTGFLWAIARDDRPWGGTDPPAVVYSYPDGLIMPLVYGLKALMAKDEKGHVRWKEDPARFLDDCLQAIVKKYRVILDPPERSSRAGPPTYRSIPWMRASEKYRHGRLFWRQRRQKFILLRETVGVRRSARTHLTSPDAYAASDDVPMTERTEVSAVETVWVLSEHEDLAGREPAAAMPDRHVPMPPVAGEGSRADGSIHEDAAAEAADAVAGD